MFVLFLWWPESEILLPWTVGHCIQEAVLCVNDLTLLYVAGIAVEGRAARGAVPGVCEPCE